MSTPLSPIPENIFYVTNLSPTLRTNATPIKPHEASPTTERSTTNELLVNEDQVSPLRQRSIVTRMSTNHSIRNPEPISPNLRQKTFAEQLEEKRNIDSLLTSHKKAKFCTVKKNVCFIAVGIISMLLIIGCTVVSIISLINSLKRSIPAGSIFVFTGTASDLIARNEEWLFCDGSEISRDKYRNLFNVIGTSYGAGNGVDTFNIPDLRNRYIRGTNTSSTSQLRTGGSTIITVTVSNMPSHDHTVGTFATATDGTHTHSVNDPGHNHGGSTAPGDHGPGGNAFSILFGGSSEGATHTHSIPTGYTGISIVSNGAHTHTISGSTTSTGSGQPIDTSPPFTTMHHVIKT